MLRNRIEKGVIFNSSKYFSLPKPLTYNLSQYFSFRHNHLKTKIGDDT